MTTSGACQLTRQETTFTVIVQLDWSIRGPAPRIARAQIWDAVSGNRLEVTPAELALLASHFPPLLGKAWQYPLAV